MNEYKDHRGAAKGQPKGGDRPPTASGEDVANKALTVPQERLISELVLEPVIQTAARAAGVSRTTAHRWLRQPAFRDELSRRRDDALTDAIGIVKAHARRAVEQMVKLLDTQDERLRRMTCNDILGHAFKAREMEDIERRLTDLEKMLKNKKGRPA